MGAIIRVKESEVCNSDHLPPQELSHGQFWQFGVQE